MGRKLSARRTRRSAWHPAIVGPRWLTRARCVTPLAAVAIAVLVSVLGFRKTHRKLEVDEAIDAARSLALRELRDWLERNRPVGTQSKPS